MRALAEHVRLQTPLLDVGCGDGLFWEILCRELLEGGADRLGGLVGIDIDSEELQLASARLSRFGGRIDKVDIELGDAALDPGYFRTVLCNCSIEHVPKLEVAMMNIRDLMCDGGMLVMFVPAPQWSSGMLMKQALVRFSPRIGATYGALFDGFFQHHHLYPDYVWRHLLSGLGFSTVQITGLGSGIASRLFERHLPWAWFEFMHKTARRRYPRLGALRARTMRGEFVDEFFAQVASGEVLHREPGEEGVTELVVVCKK